MARIRLSSVIACMLLVLNGSSAFAQLLPPDSWQSPLYADHELVGKIWSSSDQQFISADSLWQQLIGARYLLLGEKHDNPDHHDLQLNMLQTLIQENAVSQLTLEMLDSTANEALSRFLNSNFGSTDEIKSFLNWDEEGWDWNFYGPL